MVSMYEEYIKERENLDVIKTDRGFIVYKTQFPNCIINDCFIQKEFRNDGHATFLANQVFEICKGAGIKSVYCQTDNRANGEALSRTAIENFGFEIVGEDDYHTFYKMEVSEWENL